MIIEASVAELGDDADGKTANAPDFVARSI